MVLLDFGASREFSKSFVDQYIKVIRASSMKDKAGVLKESQELGFLTGYETKVWYYNWSLRCIFGIGRSVCVYDVCFVIFIAAFHS